MLQLVRVAQAVDAKKRIASSWKWKYDLSYFGKHDVWHYISISDERRCINCESFNGLEFFGDEIRTIFPDLELLSPNVISVNVHLTLWNKDTCRCKMVRKLRAAVPRLGLINLVKGQLKELKETKQGNIVVKK